MKGLQTFLCPHPPLAIQTIGQGKERGIQKTIEGYRRMAETIGKLAPETIVFISPHGNVFRNGISLLYKELIQGDFKLFGYEEVAFTKTCNLFLTSTLHELLTNHRQHAILLDEISANQYQVDLSLDHGVMVPMYFIDQVYTDYEIVHLTTSYQSAKTHYHIGAILEEVLKQYGKKVVVVASGDLSHALSNQGPYEARKEGPAFDEIMVTSVRRGDALPLMSLTHNFIEASAQCGLGAFSMAFGLYDGEGFESEVYSYEGPYGVGYMVGELLGDGEPTPSILEKLLADDLRVNRTIRQGEDAYVLLARKTIEHYILTHRKLVLTTCPSWLEQEEYEAMTGEQAGIFVTLHKHGNLRGCIGTVAPSAPTILEEIMYSAISAASNDPRFNQVTEDELMEIEISVDRLYEQELVDDYSQLNVKRYGVIVEKDDRLGLLLPNIDGIDTVEEQVAIAKQKAGIYDTHFKLYRFEVERHE